MRINMTCPICKRPVRKYSEDDELHSMVATEDEDGRIIYWHYRCWEEAIEDDGQ